MNTEQAVDDLRDTVVLNLTIMTAVIGALWVAGAAGSDPLSDRDVAFMLSGLSVAVWTVGLAAMMSLTRAVRAKNRV